MKPVYLFDGKKNACKTKYLKGVQVKCLSKSFSFIFADICECFDIPDHNQHTHMEENMKSEEHFFFF